MLEGKPFYKYTSTHENCMVYARCMYEDCILGVHECKLIIQLKP